MQAEAAAQARHAQEEALAANDWEADQVRQEEERERTFDLQAADAELFEDLQRLRDGWPAGRRGRFCPLCGEC
jgi:hypothetical protein